MILLFIMICGGFVKCDADLYDTRNIGDILYILIGGFSNYKNGEFSEEKHGNLLYIRWSSCM